MKNGLGVCVLDSSEGEKFLVLSRKREGGKVVLTGNVVQGENILQEDLEFQLPKAKKEVHLAMTNHYGWILVDKKTGKAWRSGIKYPNNNCVSL